MAKYEILIKAVTIQGMSYGEVATHYGVSKTLVHKLHHRWLAEGDAAHVPRIGRAHARTEIICLVHNNNATVIALNTGELLAEFTLDPTKNYQRKNG